MGGAPNAAARASNVCAAIEGPCDGMTVVGAEIDVDTEPLNRTDADADADVNADELAESICIESASSDRGRWVVCMVSQCVAKSHGKRNDIPQSSQTTPLWTSTCATTKKAGSGWPDGINTPPYRDDQVNL